MSATDSTHARNNTLPKEEPTIVIYQWTLEIFISFLSIVGNLLVVLAVALAPALQTISNYFVVNLAITDLLVGILAVPLSLAVTLGFPRNDYYGCLFINCLVVIFTQVSVFSLVGVAVDRFVAINTPFQYHNIFTSRRCVCICVATWISGIVVGIVPLFGWNLGPPVDGICAFIAVIDLKYMVYFNFFVCILPPLAIVFGIYSYIFSIVLKHTSSKIAIRPRQNNLDFYQNNSHSTRSQSLLNPGLRKSELRSARSLAIVIVVFALSWLPIHVCNSLFVIGGPHWACEMNFFKFCILISHANSMFNPFIYAVSNSVFRKAFLLLIQCKRQKSDCSPIIQSTDNLVGIAMISLRQ